MLDWLKKKTLCAGGVLFRGSLPPRPQDFEGLVRSGIQVARTKTQESERWHLTLTHPEWGKAELVCHHDSSPAPKLLIEWCEGISPAEREEAMQAGCELFVSMPGTRNHALRDRKLFLRFLGAVMDSDGLVAFDYVARRLWSRASLDEELSHDADLDISQIMEVHCVGDEEAETREWLHSHGLAEIGFFDFDILNPARELQTTAMDALRALPFAIVEGEVGVSTKRFKLAAPGGQIRLVPVEEFNRTAAPDLVALREAEDHNEKRAIVCEPAGWLFGRGRPKPNKFLCGPIEDGTIFAFSLEATQLMAERARKTIDLLRQFKEELADFKFIPLVKLGYQVDGGKPDDCEHLWFELHEVGAKDFDATLANKPYNVARLKEGDRGRHPFDLLTDWTIMTPMGIITPRNTSLMRHVRRDRGKLLELMARQDAEQCDAS